MGTIAKNKKYILLGFLLFIGSGFIGYFNSAVMQQIADELMKQLDDIATKIGENGTVLYTIWLIFTNNVLASLTMLGLGIFFGIFPIFALISNGVLLGFMLKTFALEGVNPFVVLAVGILPHGIIEIFAVVLAAGVGMKYGVYMLRMITNLFRRNRINIFEQFRESLKELPRIVGSVIVLLFIAAVIESTITPFLIHVFIGNVGG